VPMMEPGRQTVPKSIVSRPISSIASQASTRVNRIMRKTIKTALKMDVAPRAEISNPQDAKRYMELGVRNFSIGTDVSVLYSWWKDRGAELRKILSSI